ncbi:MAG: hypothetical protein M3220_14120 [Chloroflexota bacterium]|nr:hypothetical protein [Chloroflexota bacterium]
MEGYRSELDRRRSEEGDKISEDPDSQPSWPFPAKEIPVEWEKQIPPPIPPYPNYFEDGEVHQVKPVPLLCRLCGFFHTSDEECYTVFCN